MDDDIVSTNVNDDERNEYLLRVFDRLSGISR